LIEQTVLLSQLIYVHSPVLEEEDTKYRVKDKEYLPNENRNFVNRKSRSHRSKSHDEFWENQKFKLHL